MWDQREHYVVLKSVGPNSVEVIRVLRQFTALGILEARDWIQRAPVRVKEGILREEAEVIKQALEKVGATAEVVRVSYPGVDYL